MFKRNYSSERNEARPGPAATPNSDSEWRKKGKMGGGGDREIYYSEGPWLCSTLNTICNVAGRAGPARSHRGRSREGDKYGPNNQQH